MKLALAVIVVGGLAIVACEATGDAASKTPNPAASRTRGSSPRQPDTVAANVRSACESADSTITAVLGSDPTGAGAGATDYSRSRGDTTFAYWYNAKTAPGCRVSVSSEASGPPDRLLARLTQRLDSVAGWQSLVTTYSADGPDGSQLGFRHGDAMCIVAGRWDGGDDADSTYIPAPGFAVDVVCAPWRADDASPER